MSCLGGFPSLLVVSLPLAFLALVVSLASADLVAADFADLHDSSPGGGVSDTFLWREEGSRKSVFVSTPILVFTPIKGLNVTRQ